MIDARHHLSPDAVRSVLIHKPDHLGDVLCAAPSIALLRDEFPNARFFAAVLAGPGAFLTSLGLADELMPLARPDWWKRSGAVRHVARCRALRFDLAVNFRHDVRDILTIGMIGARNVCSTTHRGVGAWFRFSANPPSDDRAEIDNHLTVVRSLGIGGSFISGAFRARIPEDDVALFRGEGAWIAFHPFSRTRAKAWPIEHARTFVRMVMDRGVGVRLIGSAGHASEAAQMAVDSPQFVNDVGHSDPIGLMARVAAADALVCTDSGPGHIGPLVGTPVVTLASGTNNPRRWAPRGASVVRHEVTCSPCHLESCPVPGHPCMSNLSPEAVIALLSRVMGTA